MMLDNWFEDDKFVDMENESNDVSRGQNPSEWLKAAVGKDMTRLHLCGVWSEKGRRFATDGHRLHIVPAPEVVSTSIDPPDLYHLTNPPRIDSVIPPAGKGVEIDGRKLRAAIKRAIDLFDREGWRIPVVLVETCEGMLCVSAVAPGGLQQKYGNEPRKRDESRYQPHERGEIVETFSCPELRAHMPESRTYGFNGLYLLAALGSRPKSIKWFQRGPMDGARIDHADGRVAVVMPCGLGR